MLRARKEGWRSRAVYKLEELDRKEGLFAPGMTVVDLGAAPGAWSQYAARRAGNGGRVIGLDLLPMDPLPGVTGLKGPLSCLTQARYGITWGVIGAARACLDEVLKYVDDRVLFGRPLSHTQAIQIRLADMARRITTAQLLSLRLGRLKDAGRLKPTQVSLAK